MLFRSLYIVHQLTDFRTQQRSETDPQAYMWGVSALLEDSTIQALAEYYAVQKPPAGRTQASAAQLREDQRIFEKGLPGAGVRAPSRSAGNKLPSCSAAGKFTCKYVAG